MISSSDGLPVISMISSKYVVCGMLFVVCCLWYVVCNPYVCGMMFVLAERPCRGLQKAWIVGTCEIVFCNGHQMNCRNNRWSGFVDGMSRITHLAVCRQL